MNDLDLALNRRTLERILIDVNLDEICNLDNAGINSAVTLLQLISASHEDLSSREALALLDKDHEVRSALAMPRTVQLSDWDKQDAKWLDDPKFGTPAFLVHHVGPSVINQMGLLSRGQVNIIVSVLRFLLLMLGTVRTQ